MNRLVPPVLLLHPDRALHGRVKRACAERYRYLPVESWSELRDALHEAPPFALVIVDPYRDRPRALLSSSLQEILREFPSVTVIAACELRGGCLEQVRTLGEWGVTRVITLEEEDTPLAIARVLESSRSRPLRSLLHALTPAMSGRARAIAMSAADVVSAGGVGRDLARALHVTPRTLQRWCRRAGLPASRQLLAWIRLLLAAELLDDPGRSVLNVALACGYSSDAALRTALRSYLDMSPNSLRQRGAFQAVSRAFESAIRAAVVDVRSAGPRPTDAGPRLLLPTRSCPSAGGARLGRIPPELQPPRRRIGAVDT